MAPLHPPAAFDRHYGLPPWDPALTSSNPSFHQGFLKAAYDGDLLDVRKGAKVVPWWAGAWKGAASPRGWAPSGTGSASVCSTPPRSSFSPSAASLLRTSGSTDAAVRCPYASKTLSFSALTHRHARLPWLPNTSDLRDRPSERGHDGAFTFLSKALNF
ncbi:uncharacterized protein LOC104584481 [Brachypodium distachyon]|uniref:uncharacterized protein LOC104584481 n=1 Tax=Brachypodium distachyon TaxID=15368 RepID=UPI00071DE297|nr:uncharacterized protein LOC104584481 [Brachypodium distachyon]|eukprot:XP_014758239.1 uncharacterized protein LOC104584481 [Brachypodium distachyon]